MMKTFFPEVVRDYETVDKMIILTKKMIHSILVGFEIVDDASSFGGGEIVRRVARGARILRTKATGKVTYVASSK
jgi:hypothetical protein